MQIHTAAPHTELSKSGARKPRYCIMARHLHTALGDTNDGNERHLQEKAQHKRIELTKAPIQGSTTRQEPQGRQEASASLDQWTLMTANTTNWMGAKTLITALNRDNNPRRPAFIVFQEHRNAGEDDCRRAEDWARSKGYTLSVSPAARTGMGKLNTSGGVAVGALRRIGISQEPVFNQRFAKHHDCIHAVICNCLFPKGILLVGAYWRNGLDMKLLRKLADYLLDCGRPWILAGDWNVPPQALINTGFVAKT